MRYLVQETSITPIEASVWRICTQYSPRDGDDNDLVLIARALRFSQAEVRQALTHLRELGYLQRSITEHGIPIVVPSSKAPVHTSPRKHLQSEPGAVSARRT